MQDKKRFLDWFAGFVAGEGHFRIDYHKEQDCYRCEFRIALRDDDLAILLKIQETLGMGHIYRETRIKSKPAARWVVCKMDDILRLVDIFDIHPLLARKQEDFEIWKEAALEIGRGRGRGNKIPVTYDKEYLAYLKQKLSLIRGYTPPDIEEFEPMSKQLGLDAYAKEAWELERD